MAEITLRKYHGLGNDYLIYDPNRNACELQERQVEALCRRNLGVGADGILYGPFLMGTKCGCAFSTRTGVRRRRAETVSAFFPNI